MLSSGLGLILMCALPAAAQDARLEPNPKAQDAIRRALHTTGEADQLAALDALRALAGDGFRALVPELLYYSHKATDTRDGMAMGVLIEALRIPDASILEALVPLLETKDVALQREIAGVLSQFEHQTANRPADFSIYRPFLEVRTRALDEPPLGLVRHLYATDPGTAFLLMARLHAGRTGASDRAGQAGASDRAGLRAALWSEHVIRDTLWKQRFGFLSRDTIEPAARAEFDQLARHTQWWARLYAAQLMQDNRAFLDAGVIQRLTGDPHALVRAIATSIPYEQPGGRRETR